MEFHTNPVYWVFAVPSSLLFMLVALGSEKTWWAWYGVALLVLSAIAVELTCRYVVWYRPEEGVVR